MIPVARKVWQPIAGFNYGVGSTAAHHVADINARHAPRPELLGLPDRTVAHCAVHLTVVENGSAALGLHT
jgi:hypothetical protein